MRGAARALSVLDATAHQCACMPSSSISHAAAAAAARGATCAWAQTSIRPTVAAASAAAASAPARCMATVPFDGGGAGGGDWIHLTGMRFYGRHGVLPEETRLGQGFVVDAKLRVDLSAAGASDALEHTVSYASVYEDVRGVVEGPPCKLLEAVAHRVCARVLDRHAKVQALHVLIRKLSIPAVPSVVESVGIEVYRERR